VVLQCGAGAWLNGLTSAEISADIREAVAHWRRVRDDALYTNPYLLIYYLLSRSTAIADLVINNASCLNNN